MMRHAPTTLLALLTTLALGCEPADEAPIEGRAAHWEIGGLEPLGGGYVYEGWLIIDGEPVSTGRFNTTDGESAIGTSDDIDGADRATAFVLTIEPGDGDDPAPSATKLLAADLLDGAGALEVAHSDALGTDFTDAAAEYILETPTSQPTDDYANGIWWVDADTGSPTLSLPELPEGWQYEGWVVTEDGPITTGRFLAANEQDSDGAGPTAGPLGFPSFPGQDFIDPAMNLVGTTVVISVEPEPDDSPAPFVLKPLLAPSVEDVAEHGLQSMQNSAAMTNPFGTVRIE